ncbi:hypothetical protein PM082_011279 [Marasmius tenuissimus]|nr:hypothetical protein PM082_011279 [Marasmius tenuissimus]
MMFDIFWDTLYWLLTPTPPPQLPEELLNPKYFATRSAHFGFAQRFLAYSTRILPTLNKNLLAPDDECRIVSLVMLKCLGGSDHEVGGVIVNMPGAEGAQAILTFETTGLPDENFHTRKSPATRRTWNPPAPLCEYDVITTYRLSKLQWSPASLAELLNELHVAVDPRRTTRRTTTVRIRISPIANRRNTLTSTRSTLRTLRLYSNSVSFSRSYPHTERNVAGRRRS